MTGPGKDNAGGMPTACPPCGGPPYAWACRPESGKACPRQQRPGHATPEEATQRKRRALLAAAVRWPLAGGLALVAGRLLARNAAGPLDPDEKCVNRGLCRGCRAIAGCRSPQAELFRQAAPAGGKAPERRQA
jgi:hypothetical protein